jgi:hypothetical protein
MEVSGQLRARAALTPGKEPWNPLDRRLGGPQSWFGRCGEETLAAARNRILAVQPEARRYADSAIPDPTHFINTYINILYLQTKRN